MPHHVDLCRNYAPETLHEMGQELYRQTKYEEALEALNAAENASNGLNLTILDNRAATYEKLGNLQAALVDARSMIKWQPTEVEGYLRTGKILQKMDKSELALKIYERGLRYVSVKNENFDVLRKMNETLSKSLAPPKAVDFFVILPIELVEMIWCYVPFRTTCQCLRVSRGWHIFLKSWPFLWSNLDFSESCGVVRSGAVRQYFELSRGTIQQAILKSVKLQNTKTLSKLCRKSRLLEDLTILSGGYLDESLIVALDYSSNLKSLILARGVALSYVSMMRVMNRCPNLAIAKFGAVELGVYALFQIPLVWPKLEHLALNIIVKARPHTFLSGLLPPTPALTRLVVNVIGELRLGEIRKFGQNLEELTLENVKWVNASTHGPTPLPSYLRKLTMIGTSYMPSSHMYMSRCLVSPVTGLPLLSELTLKERTWGVAPELVQDLLRCSASKPSQLVKFDICASDMEKNQIKTILAEPRLRHVKYLGLAGLQYFADDSAFVVADTMKELLHVDLELTKVSGVGVKRLVQALPQLKVLNLNDCGGVSPDSVEWARSQGITVLYQFAGHP